MAPSVTYSIAEWASENFVLPVGQYGFEEESGRFKIGDGVTAYNDLSYFNFQFEYCETTGTDTYLANFGIPIMLSYRTSLRLVVKFSNANTGASTLNLNSFGAIPIKKEVSVALVAGDLKAGGIYTIVYDGTNFQVLSGAGTVGVPTLSQVLTAGDDATELDIKNLGALAYNENTEAQIVANTNDYAIGSQTNFRLSTDATRNITGMTGGYEGKTIIVQNIGANRIRFTNQDVLSAAANRIITGTGVTYQLNADETISFMYDSVVSRWRLRIS